MGQVFSYILTCICTCGEADDERPSETSSPLLISPPIPYSYNDSITISVSNPPRASNLVVDSFQNVLPSPNSDSDFDAMIPNSSSHELLTSEDDSGFHLILSSPLLRYLLKNSSSDHELLDPAVASNSTIDDDDDDEIEQEGVNEVIEDERWMNHYSSFQNVLPSPNSDSNLTRGSWRAAAGELHDSDTLISSSSSHELTREEEDSGFHLILSSPLLEYLHRNSRSDKLLDPSVASDSSADDDDDYDETEDEEEVIITKAVVVIEEERWKQHYSSFQKILLVGEGDFSFSASLAMAFGSAHNIIATSLDSTGYLERNYRNAMLNIQRLKSRGAKVMHGVDAKKISNYFMFQGLKFDCIVFNFPLAGFFPDESRPSQLRQNRELVRLFLWNAKKMISQRGEIHVSHKSNGFFREWKLEQLASGEGLRLTEEVRFNFLDYPGYRTKYGFGGDKNFNCNPSKTYKFGRK